MALMEELGRAICGAMGDCVATHDFVNKLRLVSREFILTRESVLLVDSLVKSCTETITQKAVVLAQTRVRAAVKELIDVHGIKGTVATLNRLENTHGKPWLKKVLRMLDPEVAESILYQKHVASATD